MRIELAIFDMDGTVFTCRTNWQDVRKTLGIKPGETILGNIFKKNRTDKKKLKILEDIEWENTAVAEPVEGAPDFISELSSGGVKTALITNNNLTNAQFLLKKYKINFDLIITRELKMWKPDPAAVSYTIDLFKAEKGNVAGFGDSIFDIEAYNNAGISDIFIVKSENLIEELYDGINFFRSFKEISLKSAC